MVRVFSSENPHRCPTGEAGAAPRESRGSTVLSWSLRLLRRAPRQCAVLVRQLGSARARHALALELRALRHGLAGAPEVLRAAARDAFCPWHWVQVWARELPNQRAIIDESGELTWRELCERAQALSAVLVNRGLVPGSFVVLVTENSRFLVTALLAIQRAGGCPVLLDPASDAQWLAHAIERTGAAMVWVANEHLRHLVPDPVNAQVLVGDFGVHSGLSAKQRARDATRGESAAQNIKERLPSGHAQFAVLLTSGSTATPRLVTISNYRAALSGYGMGSICLGHDSSDTIYCALPLSHATALLTGLCVALVTGSGFALRARFSSSHFWPDIARFRATSALYVGEIARRIVTLPESDGDRSHCVRVLYGTGMPLDVWHRLQSRFAVPRILEFYGATELPLAMVNLAGAPGYMGRIALRELSPWEVVRFDADADLAQRVIGGNFESCRDNEPGELVFMRKYRTGDIVARDAHGYVRHLDRQPGMFRQNGHNTSSHALQEALRGTSGVRDIGVTHVNLPRYDGHAGLVIVVPGQAFELGHMQRAYERLPQQQRPRFLRLATALRLNRGLKFDAAAYRREGVDPEHVSDPTYAYRPSGFVLIDSHIWRELQLGTFRL